MKRKIVIYLIAGLILFFLFYYNLFYHRTVPDANAIYFWKTNAYITLEDASLLKKYKINTIYLKTFDVVWDYSKDYFSFNALVNLHYNNNFKKFNIIPVVFIVNNVFKKILNKRMLDELVKYIYLAITKRLNPYNIDFKEIQIDCDWTPSTKEKYFMFLKKIKNKFYDKRLSVTIRLHQIKYQKTVGIPDCDKGMLMFYGLESPVKFTKKNTLFRKNIILNYIKRIKQYPLALDCVFPIFSWTILFNKNKEFIKIYKNIDINIFRDNMNYKKLFDNIYVAKKDTLFGKDEILTGDIFKFESADKYDIIDIKRYFFNNIKHKNINIALFYYEKKLLEGYYVTEKK